MLRSNMVLYFVDNYVRNEGKPPKNMVEENIRGGLQQVAYAYPQGQGLPTMLQSYKN